MRAVSLDFEHRLVVENEVPPPPAPASGQALLRIVETGLCATDRELARFRFGEPPPGESTLILGHEALAQVVEVNGGGLQPGEWVVPMIRRPCPSFCPSCAARRRDLCRTGLYLERGINRSHGYFTEFAVDPIEDLVAIPADLLDVAILIEPLSVVEKAIDTAFRAQPLPPRTAIVAGAGPVGILTALALLVRGIGTTVISLEPEDHPRVQLLRKAGVNYLRGQNPQPADLVFEASGGDLELLPWVASQGVLVLIGAAEHDLVVQPLRMLIDNLTIAGIVNAGPAHFEMAVRDLSAIPRPLLQAMIERRSFSDLRRSLRESSSTPKLVHRI
jgi:threonine dehydrogenase-like Zn-dependent dehydrogenase